MKTNYLTTLSTTFNPFSRTAIVPRLFLQLLPPKAHNTIKIERKVLPKTSTAPAKLDLGFKDGQKMTFTWAERQSGLTREAANMKEDKPVLLSDIVDAVDRHARVLSRKEELQG